MLNDGRAGFQSGALLYRESNREEDRSEIERINRFQRVSKIPREKLMPSALHFFRRLIAESIYERLPGSARARPFVSLHPRDPTASSSTDMKME